MVAERQRDDAGVIAVLDADVANQIAAGEVVERPASVVKELVENALDAGARHIHVEIKDGGRELIRVTDDGAGIPGEQARLAFARHATSKIRQAADLFAIQSLGFRGEALPSIAAVAEVEMRTRAPGEAAGTRLLMRAGEVLQEEPTGAPQGTTMVVRRLFFNTPARYKFLKATTSEKRHVMQYVSHMALAHPGVAFSLTSDGRQVLSSPGDGDLLHAVAAVRGAAAAREMLPVQWECALFDLTGVAGRPNLHRGDRNHISLFLNGRWIQTRLLAAAVEKAYDTLLPSRRFPVVALHLTADPASVDVNVHPAKVEVRFRDDREMFRNVLVGVKRSLLDADLIPSVGHAWPVPSGSSATSQDALAAGGPVGDAPADPADRGAAGDPVDCREAAPVYLRQGALPRSGDQVAPRDPSAVARVTRRVPGTCAAQIRDAQQEAAAAAALDVGEANGTGLRLRDGAAARRVLHDMHILGQIHRTYLLGATPTGLWVVDQHVAHERIIFERLLAKGRDQAGHPVHQQPLLLPVTLQLAPEMAESLRDHITALAGWGFDVEDFGGNAFLLRAVPLVLGDLSSQPDLLEAFEELTGVLRAHGGWQAEDVASSLACRSAVKAGHRLQQQEMRRLVDDLAQMENPFTCPHGRPIIVELTRGELERRFGRH